MKKTVIILSLLLLVLLLMSGFFWLYEAKYFIGRATVALTEFSVANSYLFVSPLKAQGDGQEKIRITVFILNNQGTGVPSRKVIISSDPALQMETAQGFTDAFGKAVFDVSSSKPGEYYLEVTADAKVLPQKAHLLFY